MSSEVDFEDFGAQDPLANRMACGIFPKAGTPARVVLHNFLGNSHPAGQPEWAWDDRVPHHSGAG